MTDASEHLAGLLDSQYQSLLDEWVARAGSAPELATQVPRLLEQLIDELRAGDASPNGAPRPEPPRLFPRGFVLRAVVEEYGLLQRIVLSLLEQSRAPVSLREVRRLGDWFTRAVAQAAAEHERFEAQQAIAPRPAPEGDEEPGLASDLDGSASSAATLLAHAVNGRDRRAEARAEVQVQARARQRLRAMMMQAPVAVSVLRGPSFVYEFANSLALKMAGRTDVMGKTIREVFPELTEDAAVLRMLEQVYASGQPYSADEYAVSIDRRGDGTREDVYFNFTCQPVRGDDGEVQDILTVGVDVSSQVHARQRIEGLMQELTRADQRKDEFLAMLAHELRNPMAAISTALTLLDQGQPDTIKAARYRETARRQMSNLVRLVDDLLDVARLTRGKVELRKTDVDVSTVVQHALAATRPAVEARQHELTVTLAPGSFRVLADAMRLEQVVVNLLTNAAKYTEPGGTISVHLGADDQSCVLSVRDTGRGIPEDMLDKVFDLFTQLSPSIDRGTGGLGLGLTLVKHLVEMHGGSVCAASAGIGKGSEFSVRLPLHIEQGRAAADAPGKAVERVTSNRKRVVVVEDSEDVRELLKECIEQLGHEVSVARDGLEGVALIESTRPELALIDVGLPGIDGYEVARRVRAEGRGVGVRLVALTGYGGAEVKQAAHDAGFDEHVTKPIEIDRLREVLA